MISDRLGTIFTPVKSDVNGNVEKLKKARQQNPSATTLQQLILAEKKAGTHKDKNGASTALLWFKRLGCTIPIYSWIHLSEVSNCCRAMQFIFGLLQKVARGVDATQAAKEAYADTLSHYHGFMVRNTFSVGLMAAPSTATMLPLLGSDPVLHLLHEPNSNFLAVMMSVAGTYYSGNARMGIGCGPILGEYPRIPYC